MSDPDTIVALTLAFIGGIVVALGYHDHPTWCRWVRSFRRRSEGVDPSEVAHDLVAHALAKGEAIALGWRVVRVGQAYRITTPAGVTTVHPSAPAAMEAIERRLRAGAR